MRRKPPKPTSRVRTLTLDWERVNVSTHTLYTLIQALETARKSQFGNLDEIGNNILAAATWLPTECSYASVLVDEPFGRHAVKFRRSPNVHFEKSAEQVVKMLVQDLTTIFDGMLSKALAAYGEAAGVFPQSKIQKLSKRIEPKFKWSVHGCFELVAARNVLAHNDGYWNQKSIDVIKGFVSPAPSPDERLTIGLPMLFRYRKAMRTFLNEVCPP